MRIRDWARSLRPLTAAAAGVLAFVLLGASPASAHYVYEGVFTYRSSDNCTYGRAEISHGDGNGYARTDVESETQLGTPSGVYQCALAYERPSGYLAAKTEIYAWNGSDWYLCAATDWHYNSTVTSAFIIESRMIGSPICGSAYYGTMGTGYVWNGAWYGGSVWSGYHWLPDYSLSAADTPDKAPSAGDTVGVVDASGEPVLTADDTPATAVVGGAPVGGPAIGIEDESKDGSEIADLIPAAELVNV